MQRLQLEHGLACAILGKYDKVVTFARPRTFADDHEEEGKEGEEGEEGDSTHYLVPRTTLMMGHNASDCILNLNDGAHLIYASSTGLCQRSPFFEALFRPGFKEERTRVVCVELPCLALLEPT